MKINNLLLIGLTILLVLLSIALIEVEKDLKAAKYAMVNLKAQIKVEQDINEALYQENKILTNEVTLRQDITSLIVDAARSYNLDPMLLAKLIKSESNFRPNPKHALPHVTGPAGINTKAWKHTKHNPHSYVGSYYAGAEILSHYIEDSDSLTLALTRYKGLSPLGLSQAKQIVKEIEQ